MGLLLLVSTSQCSLDQLQEVSVHTLVSLTPMRYFCSPPHNYTTTGDVYVCMCVDFFTATSVSYLLNFQYPQCSKQLNHAWTSLGCCCCCSACLCIKVTARMLLFMSGDRETCAALTRRDVSDWQSFTSENQCCETFREKFLLVTGCYLCSQRLLFSSGLISHTSACGRHAPRFHLCSLEVCVWDRWQPLMNDKYSWLVIHRLHFYLRKNIPYLYHSLSIPYVCTV